MMIYFAPVRVSICDTGFTGLVKRAFIVVQLYMRVLSSQIENCFHNKNFCLFEYFR